MRLYWKGPLINLYPHSILRPKIDFTVKELMNKKPIYTTYSFYEFLKVIFFWAILAIGFFLLVSVYKENPVVILILLIVDVFFIMIIGYRQISIYEDRVVMMNVSVVSIVLNLRGSKSYFRDMRAAEYPPSASVGDMAGAAIVAGFLRWIARRRTSRSDDEQLSFYLEMKDGTGISVYTGFDDYKIKKIVELINLQIAEEKWKQS